MAVTDKVEQVLASMNLVPGQPAFLNREIPYMQRTVGGLPCADVPVILDGDDPGVLALDARTWAR